MTTQTKILIGGSVVAATAAVAWLLLRKKGYPAGTVLYNTATNAVYEINENGEAQWFPTVEILQRRHPGIRIEDMTPITPAEDATLKKGINLSGVPQIGAGMVW